MSQYFGIYVGNSSASIAIYKDDDKVEILANHAGDRVTPAVIHISSKEQVVGCAAVASLTSKATSTVTRNKTFLDQSLDSKLLEKIAKHLPVKYEIEDSSHISYLIPDNDKILKYSPVQVATFILKTLYSIGKSAAPGQKELKCVVCVPRHWNQESRKNVVEAAEAAGWQVLQLISEPSAATLAYRLDVSTENMNVLIYRLGGVSCDATVINFNHGYHSVLSSVRSDEIGGEGLVLLVRDHLVEEFYRKFRLDPKESRKSMAKLKLAAENILQILSTLTSCSKFVESVCEGVDFSITVSRARLEALISPLLSKLVQPIKDALEAANLESSKIRKVILCGGPLKIPRLVSYVTSMFPSDVEIMQGISPDEVFAIGAAYQVSYLSSLSSLDAISEPTFPLPVLTSPLSISFNSQDEIVLKDLIIPFNKQLSVPINEETLIVEAKQECTDGAIVGKVEFKDLKYPGVLQIHIKGNLQNELLIETLDNITKEVKSATINFQHEE